MCIHILKKEVGVKIKYQQPVNGFILFNTRRCCYFLFFFTLSKRRTRTRGIRLNLNYYVNLINWRSVSVIKIYRYSYKMNILFSTCDFYVFYWTLIYIPFYFQVYYFSIISALVLFIPLIFRIPFVGWRPLRPPARHISIFRTLFKTRLIRRSC